VRIHHEKAFVAHSMTALPASRTGQFNGQEERSANSRSIRVAAVHERQDRDSSLLLIDAVDDAIGATPSAVSIGKGRVEPFAYSLRVVQQRTNDELVCRHSHSLK
jgi:hypothetical protein